MKRIVSLVLALSMVLSMFATAFAGTTLTDVEGTEYESAVSALVELGLVQGRGNNKYEPESVVTRAEMAKLLVIASGLEDAAELNVGATKFSDVPANHWATGFINVASEYGFINGYPDGTFAPDAQVKYSEAVTMAIRALGYASIVESKGTWPTNYIQQARELKVLDEIKYASYSNGATRGNVAKLVWNMLRTYMWDITGENESNGLNYGKNGMTMIDKYFEDYTYAKVLYSSFRVNEDGKVMVTMDDGTVDEKDAILENAEYEYLENDFYTFVNGTEVEVLVNEEDKILLTIVPTDTHKLVDGAKDSFDKTYDDYKTTKYDYVYARVKGKTVNASNLISTSSVYVDEIDSKTDFIRLNGKTTKYKDDDWNNYIIIKDGERVEGLKDNLKVGDILTTVTVKSGNNTQYFYVIGGTEAEGELTRYAEVKFENSDETFEQMIVSEKKYSVDVNATYVEDTEEEYVDAIKFADAGDDVLADMDGEEVVLKLDPVFGKVVRVEFDGKIDAGAEEDTTVKFFGIMNYIDRDTDTREYFVELENETESKEYYFLKNSAAEKEAKAAFANGRNDIGKLVAVVLNDEDKIEYLRVIAEYDENNDPDVTTRDIPYGDEATENYKFKVLSKASYNKDEKVVEDSTDSIKVNDSTVVVKLVYDDNGTPSKDSDDEYRVEFEKGLKAVAKIKTEDVWAIYDEDSSFTRAKYLVIFEDTSSNSDNLVAKVVSPDEKDVYVGGARIDLEDEDGTEISAKIAEGTRELSNYELLVYTITTNSKNEKILNYVAGLTETELTSGENTHGYVGKCDSDRVFLLDNDKEQEIDFDAEKVEVGGVEFEKDVLEDYLVVEVSTTASEDDEDVFEVTSFKTITYEEISVNEGDRISIDPYGEVIFIISGMGKIKAN